MIQDSGNTFLPAYDAMGNIHALMTVSAATIDSVSYSAGDIVAAYDGAQQCEDGSTMRLTRRARPGRAWQYDAFGQTLRESGKYAASNPFRFSTKYTDIETGLVYYGHRYYSPSLGRFINRDPIEEQGGINLYTFVGNNPVNAWDYLGMIYQLEDHTPVIWGDGMVGVFSIATLGPITSTGFPIDASVAGAYMLNHGNYFDGATLTATFSTNITYTSHSVEYTTGSITSTFNTASMALPSQNLGSGANSVNHTTIASSSEGSSLSQDSGVVMLDPFVVRADRWAPNNAGISFGEATSAFFSGLGEGAYDVAMAFSALPEAIGGLVGAASVDPLGTYLGVGEHLNNTFIAGNDLFWSTTLADIPRDFVTAGDLYLNDRGSRQAITNTLAGFGTTLGINGAVQQVSFAVSPSQVLANRFIFAKTLELIDNKPLSLPNPSKAGLPSTSPSAFVQTTDLKPSAGAGTKY